MTENIFVLVVGRQDGPNDVAVARTEEAINQKHAELVREFWRNECEGEPPESDKEVVERFYGANYDEWWEIHGAELGGGV